MQIIRTGRMDELRFNAREKATLERAMRTLEEARTRVEQYAGEDAAFEFARAAVDIEECLVEGVRLPERSDA